jgi:hypothetical protein
MVVDIIVPFSNQVDMKGRVCTLVLKDVLRKPAPSKPISLVSHAFSIVRLFDGLKVKKK